MLVLAIESSCDETGVAVIADGRFILSNVVATQIDLHNRFGGVVPEVASRQQLTTIMPVLQAALDEAGVALSDVDAIAATYGPGLAGSLLIGLTVGKSLAFALGKPFLGVNHMEAHMYANWLRPDQPRVEIDRENWAHQPGDPLFPLLSLVVSGAHTELVYVPEHGNYQLLGQTRDDAAGEAFDKVARILGLPYPGGPAIQQLADQAEAECVAAGQLLKQARKAYQLPRAWVKDTYDFSFSGLKTAMLHLAQGAIQEPGQQTSRYTQMGEHAGKIHLPRLASSFQEAIVDVLGVKTRRAASELGVKQVIFAGGVAANRRLRDRLREELAPLDIDVRHPQIRFCTDNAAMIGSAAYFHLMRGEQHGFDLDVEPGLTLPFRTA